MDVTISFRYGLVISKIYVFRFFVGERLVDAAR